MKIVDAHTHVQFPAFDSDRDAVLERAKKNDIFMIAVGTQAHTSQLSIELARKFPMQVRATVGFHPNHVDENWHHDKKEQVTSDKETFSIDTLRVLAKEKEVVAIGECGLDYYRLVTSDKEQEARKEKQKEVFMQHMELAREVEKPLMIHCRPKANTDDAYEDLLSLVTNFQLPITIPKIVHFYVGSLKITKKLLDAGFYFTFGGVITFARDYDEIIQNIPLERILLETDAPYIAPEPYRGKKNEPAYIIETAKKLAQLKGVDYDTIQEITTKTAQNVFKI